MTKHQLNLDQFYVAQIAFWLLKANECDNEIIYWERKRQELRHDSR